MTNAKATDGGSDGVPARAGGGMRWASATQTSLGFHGKPWHPGDDGPEV